MKCPNTPSECNSIHVVSLLLSLKHNEVLLGPSLEQDPLEFCLLCIQILKSCSSSRPYHVMSSVAVVTDEFPCSPSVK